MKMLAFISLLYVCAQTYSTVADQPSLGVRITKLGLDSVNELISDVMKKEILTIQIPDIQYEDITASNIKVNSFDAASVYSLQPPNTLTWGLQNGNIGVSMTIRACKKIITNICITLDVTAKAKDVNVQVSPSFGRSMPENPAIVSVQCKDTIGDLDLDISGGIVGWVVDLFHSLIAKEMKSEIQQVVCETAKNVIMTKVDDKLAQLPMHHKIGKRIDLDYGLVEDPIIASDYAELGLRGAITDVKNPSAVSPYPSAPFSRKAYDDRMIYGWISDKMVNDFLFVLHESGLTNLTLTGATPTIGPFLGLHCSSPDVCFGLIFPDIASQFPNTSAVNININTKTAPFLETNADGTGDISVNVTTEIYVSYPEYKSIAVIDAVFGASYDASIADMKVVGQVNISTFSLKVIGETMLDADTVKWLENAVPLLAKPILAKLINGRLEKGFALPTIKGLTLVNPQIFLLDRTVQFETDVLYTAA